MEKSKRDKLAARGWRAGGAEEFLGLIDVYIPPTPNQSGPIRVGQSIAIENANDYTLAINIRRMSKDDSRRPRVAQQILKQFPQGSSIKDWAHWAIEDAYRALGAVTIEEKAQALFDAKQGYQPPHLRDKRFRVFTEKEGGEFTDALGGEVTHDNVYVSVYPHLDDDAQNPLELAVGERAECKYIIAGERCRGYIERTR